MEVLASFGRDVLLFLSELVRNKGLTTEDQMKGANELVSLGEVELVGGRKRQAHFLSSTISYSTFMLSCSFFLLSSTLKS